MQIKLLDHVNIRTERFDDTLRFYEDVLGMRAKPLSIPGSGMGPTSFVYDDRDLPVLHVCAVQRDHPEQIRVQEERLGRLNHRIPDELKGTGAIDHIAFQGEDYDTFLKRVEELGIVYQEVGPFNLPGGVVMRQINVRDPNDILIEMNFQSKQAQG